MAKKKVHELAKELGLQSKDIIDMLAAEGIKKTAASGLEDNEEAIIAAKTKKENAPAMKAEKKPENKSEGKKEGTPVSKAKPANGQAPKKKSSMTFVFNGQNASAPMKNMNGQGNKRNGQGGNRPEGNKNNKPGVSAPAAAGIIKPRDKSERTILSASMRNLEPEVLEEAPTPVVETKPIVEEKTPVVEKKADKRPDNRRDSDKSGGGFKNANQGNQRNTSDNKQGRNFDKQHAQNSERNRGGDRFNQNRQSQSNGRPAPGRGAQSAPQAPAAEISAKSGRENRKGHNAPQNKQNNYDKKGSKKQENLLNLEKQTGHKKRNATPQAHVEEDPTEIKTITLPERISIKDLADRMKKQASEIVKKLFMKGQMVTVNQEVSFEEAEEIALEFNYICEPEEKVDVIAELLKEDDEDEAKLKKRPPVVCVMGHVDHGKTSLLDAIRHTKVTDKEAGGITQAIGAYQVMEQGQLITFLDTPGHEAFTAMRMRGANSTDIAILVVAADDGVMPQTVEAINHAKAAGVEIIVAVNKIDKPAANIDKVKQELSEYELIPEDWGGSTVFCPVSAHTKEGIDNLLDMILLTADVLELKANPKRNARGLVIEAELDKGRGAVATILVQKGTLKVGQPIACGASHGKVRAMLDENGRNVKEAGPSTPVAILGLDNVPDAGETFVAFDSDKEAKAFADTYISEGKNKLIEETKAKMSLDDLFSQIQQGNLKELNIIVKADVQGSVEAVKSSLTKLSNEEVVVKVIHGGVGAVNESDVILASASNAIIIAFNVRPDPQAKATAEREGVDVRLYKVIYNAIEDVEAAMKGMLDPIFEEKIIGHAQVRQVFKASGVGNIAGSYILDGMFERGCKVRLTREGEQLCDVNLASLKRFKDDVKEVKAGFECGLVLDGWSDIQEDDMIEAYKMVEVPR